MTLCADTLQTTTPLVSKVLLTWLVESYAYSRISEADRLAVGLGTPRGIGYGIGVAFGIFAMQGQSKCLIPALPLADYVNRDWQYSKPCLSYLLTIR